ncbi:MAG: indole-3-glycerol phosphate synthase TrpC [Alicyclobacillus macrosporangiidus]|uniref:indole-3-glycerol phosphate synthase TrpC n=1 Tax=Alicyclobacillus macrosporangiidus TaxID=392015 RepID=UPI0026EC0418|nr:indole-3-glycerol phosphate synthase TrpC [Alicyclobacillus macrosporangiidus]MCL6598946.1 indole-3-glycerol phosphate synthase TrpC [Alicyclobacillus macrosporangiidus]
MSGFLQRILETKREEVARLRPKAAELARQAREMPPCRGFAAALRQASGLAVIAEVKQASPSKGLIAAHFDPVGIAVTYERAGASAISVLTDETYFRGSIAHLQAVREVVTVPVLRKDFIIDEVQIDEARAAGADAVLLICAALPPDRLLQLAAYAKTLGLDTLVEVHHPDELPAALAANPSVLGINNRDLRTFEVSLETTQLVLAKVPKGVLAIGESGIHSAEDAARMAAYGARGILVGESLMRSGDPEAITARLASFRVPLPAGVSSP